MWVAEKNSVILGWVAFGPSRDEDASPITGEIEAVYIRPECWGQGIGKSLLSAAANVLLARQFTRVTLWTLSNNRRAIDFYKAQGFEVDSCPPKVSERGDQKLEEVRYELMLC